MGRLREILVTGGAGFIGSHLVDRLIAERTWHVTVFDNFDDAYSPEIKYQNIVHHQNCSRFTLINADICNADKLGSYFKNVRPDCVVHLAAKTGVRQSIGNFESYAETNITGTLRLLDIVRNHGVDYFIYGSSSSVYGDNAQIPFEESDTSGRPISPYGMTKAAGELLCHTYSHLYNLRCVCLRLFSVYGARQRPDLAIHKFAKLITEGRPIPAYGIGKTRDYVFIDEIITGIRSAIDYNETMFEIINLSGPQPVELSTMIGLLEKELETKAVIQRLPLQPGDQPYIVADTTKAKRLLSYQPETQIEDGVKRFIDWFKENRISNLTDLESFRRTRKVAAA